MHTLEQWQEMITHLREAVPNVDTIIVDAVDPKTAKVVASIFCKFRPPCKAGRQDGSAMICGPDGTKVNPKGWQHVWVNPFDAECEPARVLYEFGAKYVDMEINTSLMAETDEEARAAEAPTPSGERRPQRKAR